MSHHITNDQRDAAVGQRMASNQSPQATCSCPATRYRAAILARGRTNSAVGGSASYSTATIPGSPRSPHRPSVAHHPARHVVIVRGTRQHGPHSLPVRVNLPR